MRKSGKGYGGGKSKAYARVAESQRFPDGNSVPVMPRKADSVTLDVRPANGMLSMPANVRNTASVGGTAFVRTVAHRHSRTALCVRNTAAHTDNVGKNGMSGTAMNISTRESFLAKRN